MIGLVDLDDPACQRPEVAGGKAAWLSRGLAAGLPVLPGLVVPVDASAPAMRTGADALSSRGSGGARLAVAATDLPAALATDLVTRAAALAGILVVRSSSPLEESGAWSGAFTSYLDVRPGETPRAVVGCWASAFSIDALGRSEAAGVEAGSVGMAVVVQPALRPEFGGTARLEGDEVVVNAVAGSPAPLVQGWEPGRQVRVGPGGTPRGSAADLLGTGLLGDVIATVRRIESIGANACEWAVAGGNVFVLQFLRSPPAASPVAAPAPEGLVGEGAMAVARMVRRYPGPMGETLVLPWALGDLGLADVEAEPLGVSPTAALSLAQREAAALSAQTWAMHPAEAIAAAAGLLRRLRGPEPGRALAQIARLGRPDREKADLVLAALATVRAGLVESGSVASPDTAWHIDPAESRAHLEGRRPPLRRVGVDRWEPFGAAVTMANSKVVLGTPSAPGIAHGRLCWMSKRLSGFRPRDVIVAPYPTQQLAPLLWDAAAVVTIGGSPAAHLFESARALGIPAVSSIRFDEIVGMDPERADGRFALAVDGGNGAICATAW